MKYDFSINYFEKNNWIYETKLITLFKKKARLRRALLLSEIDYEFNPNLLLRTNSPLLAIPNNPIVAGSGITSILTEKLSSWEAADALPVFILIGRLS